MKSQFGRKIRTLRVQKNLLLRHVAPILEMDAAQLSKIEKGLRLLKRNQIPIIANILNTDSDELFTLWLADQVYNVIEGEPMADQALKSVSKKIRKEKLSND
jgi:transcriptional regulator with XRE-family HTH domain